MTTFVLDIIDLCSHRLDGVLCLYTAFRARAGQVADQAVAAVVASSRRTSLAVPLVRDCVEPLAAEAAAKAPSGHGQVGYGQVGAMLHKQTEQNDRRGLKGRFGKVRERESRSNGLRLSAMRATGWKFKPAHVS